MRKSKRVRVRVDLVVEFDNELEGVPSRLADVQGLTDAFAKAIRKSKVSGVEAILPGARFKFNLDFRLQTSPHEVVEIFEEEETPKRKRTSKKKQKQPSVKESSHR